MIRLERGGKRWSAQRILEVIPRWPSGGPLAAFILLVVVGCSGGTSEIADAGFDGDAFDSDAEAPRPRMVDILFVIDTSCSMQEEQDVLTSNIDVLVNELVGPTPDPTTGEVAPPVEDLHLGVVTTDMGAGGYRIMTCDDDSYLGDNGVLQNEGRLEGCDPFYSANDCDFDECPWLSLSSDTPIWDDFRCIGLVGTCGCGFEQPMEAALTALTTQAQPGGPNEGFLRDDSIVVIVFVTDEDDCSAKVTSLFDPEREDLGPMNLRCGLNDDLLWDVNRYYEGFRGIHPGQEDRVVVAGIVGVPLDGSWNVGDSLEQLRELRQVDPVDPKNWTFSCQTSMGIASHPIRIVNLIYRFEDNGYIGTVCQPDWSETMVGLARTIQQRL